MSQRNRKRPVKVHTLADMFVGRPTTDFPYLFWLTFEQVDGPGLGLGREAHVRLDGHEIATMLGNIPEKLTGTEDDRKALERVRALLRQIDGYE